MPGVWAHVTSRTGREAIVANGFRLDDVMHGRHRGHFVYLSRTPDWTYGTAGVQVAANVRRPLVVDELGGSASELRHAIGTRLPAWDGVSGLRARTNLASALVDAGYDALHLLGDGHLLVPDPSALRVIVRG